MGASELDDLLIRLGVCGWFPCGIFSLQMISGVCACFAFLGNAMVTFEPKFWCENLNVYGQHALMGQNLSAGEGVRVGGGGRGGGGGWGGEGFTVSNVEQASLDGMFINGDDVISNFTSKEICEIGCNNSNWVFDVPISDSIAAQWDLVCDRYYLKAMTETFFYFGGLTGCIFIGYLSDAFGRRRVVMAAAALSTICGLQVLWIENVYLYIAIRYDT